MRYRYLTVDVFTDRRFGGNPLAVLPDAAGLDGEAMQLIAREFNYSETAFVLPPEDQACARRVRIFTPAQEVPFAGHPNVGTAWVLATLGALSKRGHESETVVVFEEAAGPVPVTIRWRDGLPARCELEAPERLSLGPEVEAGAVAAAVGLDPADVMTRAHPPLVASVGLPFLFAEVRDLDALARARPQTGAHAALAENPAPGVRVPGIHLYTHATADDAIDIRCRMFAPRAGVPEDPATGSASCALAALLASRSPEPDGELAWRIGQGVEMGRPSLLLARAVKAGGEVRSAHVGGGCVPIAEGTLEVD